MFSKEKVRKIWDNHSLFILRAFNFLVFYFGWGFCLTSVVNGHPYLGPIVIAFFLLYHLIQIRFNIAEIILLATLGILGTINDTIYLNTGLISYEGGYESVPWLAPLWVTSIWLLFGMSLNHSLAWLRFHFLLAALLGGLGGALSYFAAARIGAAIFYPNDFIVSLIIGAVWTFIMPLLIVYNLWLNKKFMKARS